MKNIKVLTIPDIHGKSIWKEFSDLKMLWQFENIATEYDYYVFVGDYTDSWKESNTQIYNNLLEVIELKKKYPEKVILLLGNHDLPYMFKYDSTFGCTGHRPEMYWDLHELFNKNRDLFQVSFQIENYIWTHAGISQWWYNKLINPEKLKEYKSISNYLNYMNFSDLCMVGKTRGGYYHTGGPFWCDQSELKQFNRPDLGMIPLKGFHQIVGHSRHKLEIFKVNENTSITFTDCLDEEKNVFSLEIKK